MQYTNRNKNYMKNVPNFLKALIILIVMIVLFAIAIYSTLFREIFAIVIGLLMIFTIILAAVDELL